MATGLFVGRFQPFHKGHATIVRKLLDEGKRVAIMVRDTVKDKNNPYKFQEVKNIIKKFFPKEYYDDDKVIVKSIPNLTEVVYGRGVGYKIREIKLDKKTESISATNIRANV